MSRPGPLARGARSGVRANECVHWLAWLPGRGGAVRTYARRSSQGGPRNWRGGAHGVFGFHGKYPLDKCTLQSRGCLCRIGFSVCMREKGFRGLCSRRGKESFVSLQVNGHSLLFSRNCGSLRRISIPRASSTTRKAPPSLRGRVLRSATGQSPLSPPRNLRRPRHHRPVVGEVGGGSPVTRGADAEVCVLCAAPKSWRRTRSCANWGCRLTTTSQRSSSVTSERQKTSGFPQSSMTIPVQTSAHSTTAGFA